MSEQPAAGWYVDPTHRFDHRYWDGTTWTEHVSRNGQPTTDPLDGSGAASEEGSGSLTADPTADPTFDPTAGTTDDPTAAWRSGGAPAWQTGASPSWQSGASPSWQQQAGTSKPTNTKAVISLVASLVWFGGLASVVGIVLGVMAKRELRERPHEGGTGLANAGIVIGIIGVIAALFALLAFLAFFVGGYSTGFSDMSLGIA